jgi:hypothetical protein
MVAIDTQVRLARKIAEQLGQVGRNEWLRWAQLANRHGLSVALAWAKELAQDPTIRTNIRDAHRQIDQVLPKYRAQLDALAAEERLAVLGYVGWLLRIREEKVKEGLREKNKARSSTSQRRRNTGGSHGAS